MLRSPALAFALGVAFFGALHALDPRLADVDGYFHVRYASLGPAEWLGRDFRWMPYGAFEGGRWVDHQLLFHALIWPFTLVLPLLTAAKVSATLFAATMLAAFTWLLGQRGVARPLVWAVALLAVSRFFDDRMLMPRTQALSLVLLFVGAELALKGRTIALLVLGAVFAWTYHVSLALVPLATLCGLSRRELKPGLFAALGVALGYAVHPQSPETFNFLWLHAVEKVLNSSGQAVGAEWMPIDTRTWLTHVAPLLTLGVWTAWWPSRPRDDTRVFGLVGLGWLILSAFAVKWLEYAVPFTLAAMALAWRDGGRSSTWLWLVSPLALFNGAQVLDHVRTTVPPQDRLADLARALPARECAVFHADWTDFSELFFHAPQCTYTVGLDPHFLASDTRRAALVEAALDGKVTRLGAMADEVFHAGWVVTTNQRMEARAKEDPRLEVVYLEDGAGLWRVVGE